MTGEESWLAFRERGHEMPLDSTKELRLGRSVHVRELDHGTDGVAHELLSDLMAARDAGEIETMVRYKGKNQMRWLAMVYPEAATPRFLGFFDDGGTLLSWASLTTSPSFPGEAILGAIIRPPYRNLGLGTAMVQHCRRFARAVLGDASLVDLFLTTTPANARVLRIVEKLGMHSTGEIKNPGGNYMIGFKIPLIIE
jgi:ribosomal protein S18 acetylase RimI-like enzyme